MDAAPPVLIRRLSGLTATPVLCLDGRVIASSAAILETRPPGVAWVGEQDGRPPPRRSPRYGVTLKARSVA